MNKAKLKSYAPQARKDFIAAVTARANLLGLSEKGGKLEVATSQPQGDATVIAGQAWPIKVHSQRQQLIARIQKDGFAQTMEAVAYTWFNRFAALRYMELHDYLGHGHRALSSLEGTLPDILTHAADLAQSGVGEGGLPGLKPALVVEMKLAGNRDGELYRLLLVAQCNALSNVMPFLFERIDDETELLLPDNLLRTDSVISKLVTAIDEEDWEQVEIIGWLYQFYISEKKDEVIGKVVRSEDIPAATQLFTPNWIVQYLVQNSVGRLWLMANPTSKLKAQWLYYIAPADQSLEVQAQLDALIQTRVDENGDSLNPESITLLDPACGSGHILVEAYEVLKAIYLERGYQPRAIPRLILEKNLYGLDIDDRAAQMAGFALLMKARADDRRLFVEPIKLNVLSLQESKGLDAEQLTRALQTVTGGVGQQNLGITSKSVFGDDDLFPETSPQREFSESVGGDIKADPVGVAIAALISTFVDAKTFGALIQGSPGLNSQLTMLDEQLHLAHQSGDLYVKGAAQDLSPLVAQARILCMQFDAVVANPPYMGGKGMNQQVKDFAKAVYPESKSDLFAMFIERGFDWCKQSGFNSMVTMQSWMFLSSFESMREELIRKRTISTFIQIGYNSFPEINSKIAQACAFSILRARINDFSGRYVNLNSAPQSADKNLVLLRRTSDIVYDVKQSNFKRIPGSPIGYWASEKMFDTFNAKKIADVLVTREGMATADNSRFLRLWHEVSQKNVNYHCVNENDSVNNGKWFPYNKGGNYRKWYGNNEFFVEYEGGGENIKNNVDPVTGRLRSHNYNGDYAFKEGLTWSALSTGDFSIRYCSSGFLFDSKGAKGFTEHVYELLALLNSSIASKYLEILSPTIDYKVGDIIQIPFIDQIISPEIAESAKRCVEISKEDWDSFESSWDFSQNALVKHRSCLSLAASYLEWQVHTNNAFAELKRLEEKNNRIFIDAYGLVDELSSEVVDSQISITRAERVKDCQRLMSYAIGCMMGRYSLDAPGLIYALSANNDFDAKQHASFPADADGIVPLTDELWFEDEAASRIREFLLAVWGADSLAENMTWLAESLGRKIGETPDETVRRYLADNFYKDHLQTYKRRPIYWLFSSGKQGAFQALVYLHRYHEGTLARLRAEYVVPLTGKIQSRIDMLEKDSALASNTAARNKLAKEVEKLKKKHVELLAYDEQLRHHADMRITLDLDDGVKVNYGKFGNLLAEVKAVTGGPGDD